MICAGTFEQAAYEDTLAAGALCDLVWEQFTDPADSARIARRIYLHDRADLSAAVREHSRNARRLLANPDLRDDVPFCFQRDTIAFTAELIDAGVIRTAA